jgi:hypothetical protein
MIPKSENRLSDKIILKTKNLDRDPIQLNWIRVKSVNRFNLKRWRSGSDQSLITLAKRRGSKYKTPS